MAKNKASKWDAVEWQCAMCDFATEKLDEFVPHLVGHGYIEEQVKQANGQMSMHLDAKEWHQTGYAIKIDGKHVASKLVRCGRRRGDPMGGEDD